MQTTTAIYILQCTHCGHIGQDVAPQSRYVGGHGYQTFAYCIDQPQCWQRWAILQEVA